MSNTTPARLAGKTGLSPEIADFRFESLSAPFTGLEPGAHIDVHLPGDLIRQYSLWDWDPAGAWLSVAVKREDAGRGGSAAMHRLKEGALLEIGGPRNNFRLEEGPFHITLIAGGIGVTPIYPMARRLKETGADFRVFYLVRNREMAAFHSRFETLDLGERYHFHCDDSDGVLNLNEIIAQVPAGGALYTCGPEPLLNAVLAAGGGLRSGTIRFERFSNAAALDHDPNREFEVVIKSSGAVYSVGADDTILAVLQEQGITIPFGCSEGLCGSCITDVLEGEIDHRDGVLTPEEQEAGEFMCVCVSRAKSKKLVLDL